MIKLSDAEIYIMQIVWRNGQATSFDILEEVKRDKKLSENTIRTLLARMVKKKAIYVHEKYGKTYLYKPLINRDQFLRKQGNSFLDAIYEGAIEYMMVNFVKEKRLFRKEIENVLDIID